MSATSCSVMSVISLRFQRGTISLVEDALHLAPPSGAKVRGHHVHELSHHVLDGVAAGDVQCAALGFLLRCRIGFLGHLRGCLARLPAGGLDAQRRVLAEREPRPFAVERAAVEVAPRLRAGWKHTQSQSRLTDVRDLVANLHRA